MPITDWAVRKEMGRLMDSTDIRIVLEAARIALGEAEIFNSLVVDHEFRDIEVQIARERLAEVLRNSLPIPREMDYSKEFWRCDCKEEWFHLREEPTCPKCGVSGRVK